MITFDLTNEKLRNQSAHLLRKHLTNWIADDGMWRDCLREILATETCDGLG